MKASLVIEIFGSAIDYMTPKMQVMSKMFPRICGFPARQWVAQITGLHPKYKFEREFIRGHRDYSNANSKGTRGITIIYLLDDGHIYEAKYKTSWRHEERYFCKAVNGSIVRIPESEVIEWAKSISK